MALLFNRRKNHSDVVLPGAGTKPDTGESEGEKVMFGEPIPNILVVDDDQLICQQLARLYTFNGYTVVIANSAEETLERLKKEDIDLVVTDNLLPGLCGL